MTRRKGNVGLLYAGGVPAKWLRSVAAGVDGALGLLCAAQWQNLRAIPIAQPVRLHRHVRSR